MTHWADPAAVPEGPHCSKRFEMCSFEQGSAGKARPPRCAGAPRRMRHVRTRTSCVNKASTDLWGLLLAGQVVASGERRAASAEAAMGWTCSRWLVVISGVGQTIERRSDRGHMSTQQRLWGSFETRANVPACCPRQLMTRIAQSRTQMRSGFTCDCRGCGLFSKQRLAQRSNDKGHRRFLACS